MGGKVQAGTQVAVPVQGSTPEVVTVGGPGTGSISEICARYKVTPDQLKALNPELFISGKDSQGHHRHADGGLIYKGDQVRLRAPAQAAAPAAPAAAPEQPATAAKPGTDTLATRNPTVGEYVDKQLQAVGTEFKQDAQVAAISAVAAPVVAVIVGRHMDAAKDRIAKLPMDPEGKWKDQANQIMVEEMSHAKQEIINLPGEAVQEVKNGAAWTAATAEAGYKWTVDTAHAAGKWTADTVNGGIQWTKETYNQGVKWAGDTAHAAEQKAEQVYGQAVGAAGAAWQWTKSAVATTFSELGKDAGVAAISCSVIGTVPSAIIMGNHMANAYNRIMALPMDPQGHWKEQANQIMAEESNAARSEILALPSKAYHGVVDTATDAYHWAGQKLHQGGQFVSDTAHAAEKWAGDEVTAARHGLGGMFQSFGKWISGN
jgi:hypothetical protein